MFILGYAEDDQHIAYFDIHCNKYIARGGTLPWRINNPGLVQSHSHVAGKNGSMGSYDSYAIFANPEQGFRALSSWLHLKKYYNATLKNVAKHYQERDPEGFLLKLAALVDLPTGKKLKSFSKSEFDYLIKAIAKLCGYIAVGNEELSLLPRIIGKIENETSKEISYLIGDQSIISKSTAIEWIQSFRLDASIVHESNGEVYLRSRPHHSFWHVRTYDDTPSQIDLLPNETPVETLVRIIGEKTPNQCIWGFINGIRNTKQEALEAIGLISTFTGGEAVYSMPNDTALLGLRDLFICFLLKFSINALIVSWAVFFLRHLLSLSQAHRELPVIVFAHSQGAIIIEHALELLALQERVKLRIFTFGGGSFIAPGKSHPDSHNYASAADLICRLGSPNLQLLALEDYTARKQGLNREEIIWQLAIRDARLDVDSLNPKTIEAWARKRAEFYEQEFAKICNVTVLDPDVGVSWQHGFLNPCYQNVVQSTIKKYQSSLR